MPLAVANRSSSSSHSSKLNATSLRTQGSVVKDLLGRNQNFENLKSASVRYLTTLSHGHRLPMDAYKQFLRSLETDKVMKGAEKWLLTKAVLLSTTDSAQPLSEKYSSSALGEFFGEARNARKIYGGGIIHKISSSFGAGERGSLTLLTNVFKLLAKIPDKSCAEKHLEPFLSGKITLKILFENLQSLLAETASQIPDEDFHAVLERFSGKDPMVSYPLKEAELAGVSEQYQHIQGYCRKWKQASLKELVRMSHALRDKAKECPLSNKDVEKLLAIGWLALKKKFGIKAHSTQLIALLGLLKGEKNEDLKGRIAQIKTGEGKSIIIALMAFTLAMQCRAVDIVSSSQYLAIRDQRKYSGFFKDFGIATSHICKQRTPKEFQGQILYGTVSDFEFAVMEDSLWSNGLFRERLKQPYITRNFDCIIVDEADNLTIDISRNNARIACKTENSHVWVYSPILNFVRGRFGELSYSQFQLAVSAENTLVELKKILREYAHGKYTGLVEKYSDEQLRIWLKSAYSALYMRKENTDYIIKKKKSFDQRTPERVEIVDAENTGRKMEGCRWSEGVHEFIEVKHELEVERESLTPMSLSAAVFYSFYQSIFGLTGTLGSAVERKEIKDIYNIDSFDVPSHLPSQRKDAAPIIFKSEEEYLEKILLSTQSRIDERRPILILCSTIQDSLKIAKLMQDHQIDFQLLNEVQEENEDVVISRAGHPGKVTIATNTATRGTDIILSHESIENGGLHVLFTYYPNSDRVEGQGIGRAGRQGQPGSSEILLCAQKEFPSGLPIQSLPGRTFSQQEQAVLLASLKQKREEKSISRAQSNAYQAQMERYFHQTFMKKFCNKLEAWNALTKKEELLQKLSKRLSMLKLNQKPVIDIDQLLSKDQAIAKTYLRLIKKSPVEPLHWMTLLRQVAERTKQKAINAWALEFHMEVEKIMRNCPVGLSDYSNFASEKRKELDRLFEDTRKSWEHYLDPSGSGIFKLLKTITGENRITLA